MSVIFVSGIDTGIGKSYVTGLLAAYLKQQGATVTTAKLVQTGSAPIAEDIILHRQLMKEPLNDFDKAGVTCPYVFPFPASPHLAAKKAGQQIDSATLLENIGQLQSTFEYVVLEGAGGLRVPLNDEWTILDLLKEQQWPCLLASSARLGSINHTWLALDALNSIKAKVLAITYSVPPESDPEIAQDSLSFFQKQWPQLPIIPIPWMNFPGVNPGEAFSSPCSKGKDFNRRMGINGHETIDFPNFSMIQFNAF